MSTADDKRFKRIQDLVKALAEAERSLEKGALSVAALERACDDARELYERLVVLRHKAREGDRPQPAAPALAMAAEPPPAPLDATKPPPAAASATGAAPLIRLDTRSEIRQTSLIDAIAETEIPSTRPPSPPTVRPATPSAPPSLADKLGRAPITDLAKSIGLSQKFWFMAELLGNDRVAFEQLVEAINNAPGLQEARRLLADQLARQPKPPDPEALQAFQELIERRHT